MSTPGPTSGSAAGGAVVPSHPAGSAPAAPTVVQVPSATIEICDASGAAITTVQDFVVGRRVRLQVLSRPRGTPLTGIRWTVPGSIVAGYTRSPASAAVQASPALTGASVDFYWIDGDFGGAAQTVQVAATAGGRSLTATARFTVAKPRVDRFHLTTASVNLIVPDDGSATLTLEAFLPRSAGGPQQGCSSVSTVTAPPAFGGSIGITQLIHANRYRQTTAGQRYTVATSGHILDDLSGVIYNISSHDTPVALPPGGTAHTDETMHHDSPSLDISTDATYHEAFADESFKVYLQFKPDGADAIWVTLSKATWSWHGHAVRDQPGDLPWRCSGAVSSSGDGSASHELPTWSDRFTAHTPVVTTVPPSH